MKANSYAKINLSLEVKPPTADGYHPLVSVMAELELHDELELQWRPQQEGIHLTCNEPMLCDVESNLVVQALRLLQDVTGCEGGWDITLTKRIPMMAGLGGGSSNAATALTLGNQLLGSPLTLTQLGAIARRLGSDVSFFLIGGVALVEGKGERVTPLKTAFRPYVILAKPNRGVQTAAAYRLFDHLVKPERKSGSMVSSLVQSNVGDIYEAMQNDLQSAAFYLCPELKSLASLMDRCQLDQTIVCGSGSCLAGFTFDRQLARNTVRTLEMSAPFVACTEFRKF